MTKPIGRNQRDVLRALADHDGVWPGGWKWGNDSTTVRILDSLVRRGLVSIHGPDRHRAYDQYEITEDGRKMIDALDTLFRK